MKYPEFFAAVPQIRMRDPLAAFLGAVSDGLIEYTYLDAVKLAGHSCPTVASAYWMTYLALQALYGDALPERGAIRVEFREERVAGVTGVIANVVSMLTGATQDSGFKGIAGHFDRRHLLFFGVEQPTEIRFTRMDTGRCADVAANIRHVPSNPEMSALMQRGLGGEADAQQRFAALWQERVRAVLLDYGKDPEVFTVHCTG